MFKYVLLPPKNDDDEADDDRHHHHPVCAVTSIFFVPHIIQNVKDLYFIDFSSLSYCIGNNVIPQRLTLKLIRIK